MSSAKTGKAAAKAASKTDSQANKGAPAKTAPSKAVPAKAAAKTSVANETKTTTMEKKTAAKTSVVHEAKEVKTSKESKDEKQAIEKQPYQQNPAHLDGVPDMSSLIYLEGDNVLHNLGVCACVCAFTNTVQIAATRRTRFTRQLAKCSLLSTLISSSTCEHSV